jgi:hypothetical protein
VKFVITKRGALFALMLIVAINGTVITLSSNISVALTTVDASFVVNQFLKLLARLVHRFNYQKIVYYKV